jgi:cytochrome c oxidase subunit II
MPGRMKETARRDQRIPLLQLLVVGVVASAIGIAAGLAIHWFPLSASTQAGPIDHLYHVLIWCSVPIFVGVSGVVLFCVYQFRVRPGEELLDVPPIHGNTRFEVVWTAIPAIILVCLCSYAWVVLNDIEKVHPGEMRVNVTGQQFAWTFEYPQADGKSIKSDFLYLPKDRPVHFYVKALDVIHDFWVPAFRVKIDAVPGITTGYRVTPNRLGNYAIVCAELCGLGHSVMRSTSHVVTPAAFNTWIARQKAPAGAAGATTAASGTTGATTGGKTTAAKPATPAIDAKKLFADGNGTATACGACHTLADAATTGQTGPDLDKVLKGKDAAFIMKSITNPNAEIAAGFQPGIMPQNYGDTLSPQEVDALVKYLSDVAGK